MLFHVKQDILIAKGGGDIDALKTGALIAEARKELNLTQKDLAQELHVSIQAVSKWERGLNFPDILLLEPLAHQLDLTVSELLTGSRNASPQEELLRDSLRLSLTQLGGKIQTWRNLFLLAAALMIGLLIWIGYSYLQDNTKLLPQRETVISYRESTPAEELAANVADGGTVCLYDVTYADGITGERLQMELWTHEGLMQIWQLADAETVDWPRHEMIALSLNVQFGQEGNPNLFHYGAALSVGRWNGTLDDVPFLSGGFGSNVLEETTVVSKEHGVVLACYYLDPSGQGRWKTAPCLGAIEKPAIEDNQAILLLRLLYEYE